MMKWKKFIRIKLLVKKHFSFEKEENYDQFIKELINILDLR